MSSPIAKCVRTASPAKEASQEESQLENLEAVEADDDSLYDSDSTSVTDNSDTTSIASSIYKGRMEHGRRWQTKREGEYWGPSDEKQFMAMQAAHLVYLILDSERPNNLFRSPISETSQNILDLGTGNGAWAIEVADQYPSALVQGIDLYPPPDTWVPPNCSFEVDDMLKKWEFKENGHFSLIHIRDLEGSFTDRQWTGVYKQAYENLLPGGWIEEVETGITFYSDDKSLAPNSLLANWGKMFTPMWAKTGKNIDTIDTFKSRIAAAGFTNVQEKWYKVPLGGWARNPVLKEAGQFCKVQMLEGMEGYVLWALTNMAEPAWKIEEIQVYLAKVRAEMEAPGLHAYLLKRRVWGQKPLAEDGAREWGQPKS